MSDEKKCIYCKGPEHLAGAKCFLYIAPATCEHGSIKSLNGIAPCYFCHPEFHSTDPAAKVIEKGRIFNHRDGMSELRRVEMETKAREIVRKTNTSQYPEYSCYVQELENEIAAALEAERKAGIAWEQDRIIYEESDRHIPCRHHIERLQRELREANAEGYRRGLEEAAEVVDRYGPNAGLSESAWAMPNVLTILADRIRQLATKEKRG